MLSIPPRHSHTTWDTRATRAHGTCAPRVRALLIPHMALTDRHVRSPTGPRHAPQRTVAEAGASRRDLSTERAWRSGARLARLQADSRRQWEASLRTDVWQPGVTHPEFNLEIVNERSPPRTSCWTLSTSPRSRPSSPMLTAYDRDGERRLR